MDWAGYAKDYGSGSAYDPGKKLDGGAADGTLASERKVWKEKTAERGHEPYNVEKGRMKSGGMRRRTFVANRTS